MEYELIDETLLGETELKENYSKFIDQGYEFGKKLMEHMDKNVKIKDFENAFKALSNLNLNLRDDYLRMIIDVCPNSPDQLRAILSPLKLTIPEESLNAVIATLKKFQ
ncbi:hypothetical protein IHE51_01230 [Candidatus Parvarchaeota archaeon]|jgi:DNA-directed RNA polymerase subunit F|uniref:RNA polymerase Rpb4 n=1 Tax=Candidatus Acidifodinimicrobium mancum TaxID=2898728 RepID=A0A8T3USZ0_9ARCH|nr:hypothetical protein [Candidatus Acidifodinimicrobium mancum]MBE5728841.1 hypothetical protein [Candidatus Acidifodinimicrobium mancum]MBE5729205.1 hypothetical protein [Candidatus Acidifodinimicrobium mancum]MBE5730197.1 hypothetical protein [Candidatus Acidifodinimicrobium mancum]